jgi:hypothetical protein
MATIRIGDAEVPARVTGALDSEVAVEMLPTSEVLDFIVQAVPGAAAVVTIAGTEYPGRVRVTDMDDYTTVVEF